MKNQKKWKAMIFAVAFGCSGLLAGQHAVAQDIDSAARNTARDIDTAATQTANKAASAAAKGAAEITDKRYKGKEGPNGEAVYIDKKDRKYYINKRGKKVFLKPSQIRDAQPD